MTAILVIRVQLQLHSKDKARHKTTPTKWTLALNFKDLKVFIMDWSVNNLPVGSDEKDYSLFIDDSFCDLISNEKLKSDCQIHVLNKTKHACK